MNAQNKPKTGKTVEGAGHVLQLRKIGNSVGLILPKELLARLKLEEGDKLHVVEQADGELFLSVKDPAFAAGMASAHKMIKRYGNALAELAK